jgi:hypothetical protein
MRVPFFAFDKRQTEFHLKNCAPVISSNTFLALQINYYIFLVVVEDLFFVANGIAVTKYYFNLFCNP